MVAFDQNRWSESIRMGGPNRIESVVAFLQNRWSESSEYVAYSKCSLAFLHYELFDIKPVAFWYGLIPKIWKHIILENEADRVFRTERFCFIGSVDGWIMVGRSDHLGTESFYQLF